MKAVGHNLLVRRDAPETESAGGIALVIEEKQKVGAVLSVGDKVDVTVVEGDRIVFSQYGALELGLDDELMVLVRDTDVQVVL